MLPRFVRSPEEIRTDFTETDLPHDRMRAVYAYWNEKRQDRNMPPISALDPLAMPKAALSYLSIIEVLGNPARLRVRLQGTQLVEVIGGDFTWQFLDEISGTEQQISRIFWCITHQRPYLVEAMVTWGTQSYRRYSSLNLPFGTPETGVRRVAGVFAFL